MVQVNGQDWMRPLGKTGISVSAIGAGGAVLGSMPYHFGYDVPAERAIGVVVDLLRSPIRVIDTSNGYSEGESEKRIRDGIDRAGGLPADYLIATKTDPMDGDYSAARVDESIRESKERLGLDELPLVYLHDPEYSLDQDLDAPGGAVDRLVELKRDGMIGAIGLAGGDVAVMERFLDLGVFDVFLSHCRWTLVDRSVGALFDRCSAAGMGIVNAAIHGGGLLANPHGQQKYGYRPAAPETVAAALSLEALCREWDTDLPTAALQFSLRDPRIHMSIAGITRPERLAPLLASAEVELPQEFWDAVEERLPDRSVWLDVASSR